MRTGPGPRSSWVAAAGIMALVLAVGAAPALAAWGLAAPPAMQDDKPPIELTIDAPAEDAAVGGPTDIRGWAAASLAATGTGVERVEVYLDGESVSGAVEPGSRTGQLLGQARYGESRSDVGAALGGAIPALRDQFTPVGYSLRWDTSGVAPGPHTLTVYAEGPSGTVARSVAVRVAAPPAVSGGLIPPGPPGGAFVAVAEVQSPSAVALRWAPYPGAISYHVVLLTDPGGVPVDTRTVFNPNTSIILSGLTSGRSYVAYVSALGPSGGDQGPSPGRAVAADPNRVARGADGDARRAEPARPAHPAAGTDQHAATHLHARPAAHAGTMISVFDGDDHVG